MNFNFGCAQCKAGIFHSETHPANSLKPEAIGAVVLIVRVDKRLMHRTTRTAAFWKGNMDRHCFENLSG
jgi:hypothetical protein